MIIKRIYESDKATQWFECDFATKIPNKTTEWDTIQMFRDDKLKGEIKLNPEDKNGFTLYFLENGKTGDALYWNLNR